MLLRIHIDAFLLDEQNRVAVENLRDTRILTRSKINVYSGGLEAAPLSYQEVPTPDILIVEDLSKNKEKLIENLGKLAEVCASDTKVMVIGSLNDIDLYRFLLDQGVSQYILSPVSTEDLIKNIEKEFSNPEALPLGRYISFVGARGGVGSSSLAHNTAWYLSQMDKDDVILVDADVLFGVSELSFNLDTKQTIVDALSKPDRIDETLLEKFLVKHDDRLMILSSPGNFINHNINITPEGFSRMMGILRKMAGQVVVDLPRSWSPWVQQCFVDSDVAVVVASPDLCCFRNVKNIKELTDKLRGADSPFQLALNFFDAYGKYQLSPIDFAENLGIEPKVRFPFAPEIFGPASTDGRMIGEINPNHPVANTLKQFAADVGGWELKVEAVAPKKGLEGAIEWFKTQLKNG